jgi:Cu(I)/Ag(I) efflux system membrane fusion protein
MNPIRLIGLVAGAALVASAGAGGGYWYARSEPQAATTTPSQPTPPKPGRTIAYYQDPTGKPEFSPTPKKDESGRDYVPVYDDADQAATPAPTQTTEHRILYYRNPMGQPDTSPTPKKDSMGMDYLPVYADEAADDSGVVKISPGKLQTLGVRTESVSQRVIDRTIRAVGTVQFDERKLAVVSPKFEGWIETLHVNTTGQAIRRGEPLLEVYSPDLVAAEQEYLVARDTAVHMAEADPSARSGATALKEAALARLRNWDIPVAQVEQLARTGKASRTLTLRAPADGVITDKTAVQGMRFAPGDTLFRIADISQVWLIADVFEQDLASIQLGAAARVRVDAYPDRSFPGKVAFIYPTVTRETRTAKVRIELPNPDGSLRGDMYGHVEIDAATAAAGVTAVPNSAVVDGGVTQTVLIEQAPGRYQPKKVKLGRKGDGYVEVIDGVAVGDKVVVGANFLIDAESNLKAALQSFAQGKEIQQ